MEILNSLDVKFLMKIIKYYNISNITNDNDKKNLLKLINNNLYLSKDNYLLKKDYENRYEMLKGMIFNGNDNPELKNELNLF